MILPNRFIIKMTYPQFLELVTYEPFLSFYQDCHTSPNKKEYFLDGFGIDDQISFTFDFPNKFLNNLEYLYVENPEVSYFSLIRELKLGKLFEEDIEITFSKRC